MATQLYRVARVLTAAASPVARLQAVDEDGHELRLEVPVALVQRTAPGHVLVLNWSVHALPEPLMTTAAPDAPQVAVGEAPPIAAASGLTVDEAFMDLMSRVRRGAPEESPATSTTPAGSQTRDGRDIDDEFNTLLGPAQTKGLRNGR